MHYRRMLWGLCVLFFTGAPVPGTHAQVGPRSFAQGQQLQNASGLAAGLLGVQQFVTAEGRAVLMPPIHHLPCPEMQQVLARIDATNYRGRAPEPRHAADAPLFAYEVELSKTHYERCVLTQSGNRQHRGVFKRGFFQ